MTGQPLRVGIVGLEPGRSWAGRAHLPALRALPDDFEIVGVANSSLESSRRAADAAGVPRAFASVAELVASPDIDVVTVTVRVSRHRELVRAALEAGKAVYCEWPLGNGTLCPLVNEPIVNTLVPSLDDLVNTIGARCCDLAERQTEISSRTNFAWWPKNRTPS